MGLTHCGDRAADLVNVEQVSGLLDATAFDRPVTNGRQVTDEHESPKLEQRVPHVEEIWIQ